MCNQMRTLTIPSIQDSPLDFGQKFKRLFSYLTGVTLNVPHPSRNPHNITPWESPMQGVYVFLASERNCEYCLKVGKAGPNSKPRWMYNHYTLNGDIDDPQVSTLPHYIEINNDPFLSMYGKLEKIEEANYFINTCLATVRSNIDAGNKDGRTYDPDSLISSWIKTYTTRMEFIIPIDVEKSYLVNMLEGYLQWLLNPCYEGG